METDIFKEDKEPDAIYIDAFYVEKRGVFFAVSKEAEFSDLYKLTCKPCKIVYLD